MTPKTVGRIALAAALAMSIPTAAAAQADGDTPEGTTWHLSSYAVDGAMEPVPWLVDATPDITRQLDIITEPAFRRRAAERRPFDGIFLTHAHIGHYAGLAMLGNEGLGMRETPVYCTEAMASL